MRLVLLGLPRMQAAVQERARQGAATTPLEAAMCRLNPQTIPMTWIFDPQATPMVGMLYQVLLLI